MYKQWRTKCTNETNMSKINSGVKMNRSTENPATAHTLIRYKNPI